MKVSAARESKGVSKVQLKAPVPWTSRGDAVSKEDEARRTEALLDARRVVVVAAGRLSALEEALLEDRFRAHEEEDERRGADGVVELDGLVHLAREAVDEEAACGDALDARRGAGLLGLAGLGAHGGAHGVLEELDRDLHGDDLALGDVLLDHGAELRAGASLLGAEEVARCRGSEWSRGQRGCEGWGEGARARERDAPDRWTKP